MIKSINKFCAIVILIPFLNTVCLAQDSIPSFPDIRLQNRSYIHFAPGADRIVLRDFATSPLFYRGYMASFTLGASRILPFRESELRLRAGAGYFEGVQSLRIYTYNVQFDHLWKVPKFSSQRLKTGLGFMADVTTFERRNLAFGNNNYGLDFLSTIFLTARSEFSIDRKSAKHVKFWFINYHLKPVQRDLRLQVAVSALNSSYRNGYNHLRGGAYPGTTLITDYELRAHSGFRLATNLAYTRHLRNGNGLRLAYIWDANSNPGVYEKLEVAQHTIQFTFLFRANN